MALIHVNDGRPLPDGVEGNQSADAEENFLFDAVFAVAAIKMMSHARSASLLREMSVSRRKRFTRPTLCRQIFAAMVRLAIGTSMMMPVSVIGSSAKSSCG